MGTCSCNDSRAWALTAVFECCQEIWLLLYAREGKKKKNLGTSRSREVAVAGSAPTGVKKL